MKSRLLRTPKQKSFFLFGPRGTGKSTWLSSQFPDATRIDLLEDETYNRLLARPQDLSRLLKPATAGHAGQPIIIDEVQKIPALLDEVHRLIEKDRRVFILTGSSARKLRKTGANLLAGRALTFQMFPFTSVEMGQDFDLRKALRHGTLPSLLTEPDAGKFLQSYVRTYLKEEIVQEGLTRNIQAFSRFLEAASFSQATPLVKSRVAQDCHVERKVVEDYFTILEDLLLSFSLPVFSRRAKRELIHKQKFFFFDCGIFNALRPRGPLDSETEAAGVALESLVAQEIRALNSCLDWGYQMYHWRSKSKKEVDLVLYGPRGLWAIEVKSSSRLRPGDLDGLRLFMQDYPEARALCIHGGPSAGMEDGIELLPAADFFSRQIEILGS
ncbi:MAG: ATP-binding protein [Oligoflexia bacterium]|jgi:predicted AAA+ superfamily ATPase